MAFAASQRRLVGSSDRDQGIDFMACVHEAGKFSRVAAVTEFAIGQLDGVQGEAVASFMFGVLWGPSETRRGRPDLSFPWTAYLEATIVELTDLPTAIGFPWP